MRDVTAEERQAIMRHLIDSLPSDIPSHVVTGPDSREAFERRKAALIGTLERIKHHVNLMEPWADR